jgi:hypothetical protein
MISNLKILMILGIMIGVSFGVSFIIPFPFSYAVSIPLLFLILRHFFRQEERKRSVDV